MVFFTCNIKTCSEFVLCEHCCLLLCIYTEGFCSILLIKMNMQRQIQMFLICVLAVSGQSMFCVTIFFPNRKYWRVLMLLCSSVRGCKDHFHFFFILPKYPCKTSIQHIICHMTAVCGRNPTGQHQQHWSKPASSSFCQMDIIPVFSCAFFYLHMQSKEDVEKSCFHLKMHFN